MKEQEELRAENKKLHEARRGVVLYCDAVLRGVRLHPRMWGPPIACELQMLLACEVKLEALGFLNERVQSEWQRFVSTRLPKTPSSLSATDRCGNNSDQLCDLMNGFIEGPYAEMLRGERP